MHVHAYYVIENVEEWIFFRVIDYSYTNALIDIGWGAFVNIAYLVHKEIINT